MGLIRDTPPVPTLLLPYPPHPPLLNQADLLQSAPLFPLILILYPYSFPDLPPPLTLCDNNDNQNDNQKWVLSNDHLKDEEEGK